MTGTNELNASAFQKAIDAAGKKIDRVCADLHRAASIEMFGRVVQKSPVHFYKGGSFKGRWFVGINAKPSDGDGGKRSPSEAIAKAKAALGMLPPYGVVWITNNSPQARTLEYGGYPQPVKFGTFVPLSHVNKVSDNAKVLARRTGKIGKGGKRKGRGIGKPLRVQFSEAGFSRQAPKGMVRVSIEEVVAAWNQIAEAALRRSGAR